MILTIQNYISRFQFYLLFLCISYHSEGYPYRFCKIKYAKDFASFLPLPPPLLRRYLICLHNRPFHSIGADLLLATLNGGKVNNVEISVILHQTVMLD